MVALLLLTAALSLFALQHRSVEGELHVTTAISAVECSVDDAAPAGLLPGEHPSASAAELLLLLAVLLVAPLAWWTTQRLLTPSPPSRGPFRSPFLPTPGLLRV